MPEPFKPKVKGWLGNNEELFNEVYNQVHIDINTWLFLVLFKGLYIYSSIF